MIPADSAEVPRVELRLSWKWLGKIGKKLGRDVIGLLDQADVALIGHGLLKERLYADKSGIVENDAHMTPLGIKFRQNIEEYRIESADERRGSQ